MERNGFIKTIIIYSRYICPESTAIIYHCRQCIPSDVGSDTCVTNPNTVIDDKLERWTEKNFLKNKVLDVHSKLKLKD